MKCSCYRVNLLGRVEVVCSKIDKITQTLSTALALANCSVIPTWRVGTGTARATSMKFEGAVSHNARD